MKTLKNFSIQKLGAARLCASLSALALANLQAANVNLFAGDAFGNDSFDDAGGWDNGLAPVAGNDYFTNGNLLRTPDGSAANHTFQGDSLTVTGTGSLTGATTEALMWKGSGTTSVITIATLNVNGGQIRHASALADSFTLEGNLNVGANGMAFHTQGGMSVNSLISGSSFINILGDGAGRNVTFMNAANTFNGNIEVFNGGNLIIADSSVLNFDIGASGSNNAVSGAGSATYDGSFVLNLSGASSNVGDSWVLNSAAVTTYGATFSVQGFTDNGNDTWSLGDYLFSEATSTLTVVPEPSALGLAATGLFGLLARRRSHRA